jgi:hypothetical protein
VFVSDQMDVTRLKRKKKDDENEEELMDGENCIKTLQLISLVKH